MSVLLLLTLFKARRESTKEASKFPPLPQASFANWYMFEHPEIQLYLWSSNPRVPKYLVPQAAYTTEMWMQGRDMTSLLGEAEQINEMIHRRNLKGITGEIKKEAAMRIAGEFRMVQVHVLDM